MQANILAMQSGQVNVVGVVVNWLAKGILRSLHWLNVEQTIIVHFAVVPVKGNEICENPFTISRPIATVFPCNE